VKLCNACRLEKKHRQVMTEIKGKLLTSLQTVPQVSTYSDIFDLISEIKENPHVAAKAISAALKNVLWSEYTGCTVIADLSKTEKTIIGSRVERAIKKEFSLSDSPMLDIQFGDGSCADIKTTIGRNWMIPPECIGYNCILIKLDDEAFSMGLLNARRENLTEGTNRDKKRSVSALGKKNIVWFLDNHSIGF
jgi:hypothetical protein